jgi:hypothetical protein
VYADARSSAENRPYVVVEGPKKIAKQFKVPKQLKKCAVKAAGLRHFDRAPRDVVFTGVCNMATRAIYLAALNPRMKPVQYDIGGFEKDSQLRSQGPETEILKALGVDDDEFHIEPGISLHDDGDLGSSHEQWEEVQKALVAE